MGNESSIDKAVNDILGIPSPVEPPKVTPEPVIPTDPIVDPVVTPPVEPPANPLIPPVTPAINLKETFGERFNSIDEVKEFVSKAESLTTEKSALSQRIDQLSNEINALKSQNPYDDPDIYRLSKLKKDSPDDFSTYTKIMYGTVDALDLLKTDFVTKNPEYKDKSDFVEKYHKNNPRYKDFYSGEFEPDTPEYQIAKTNLELDAKVVKQSIMDKFNRIELPQTPDPEAMTNLQEQEMNAFVEQWKSPFQKTAMDFKKVPILVDSEENPNDVVSVYEYDLPEETRQEIIKEAAEMIFNAKVPLTAENLKFLKEYMEHRAFFKHRSTIIASVVDSVINSGNKNWRKKIHNPPEPTKDTGHMPQTPTSKREETFKRFETEQGL